MGAVVGVGCAALSRITWLIALLYPHVTWAHAYCRRPKDSDCVQPCPSCKRMHSGQTGVYLQTEERGGGTCEGVVGIGKLDGRGELGWLYGVVE